ncbi:MULTISPECIES: efflux RND transporter periplasmic adaptor subunit [unclassified Roseibium]|uniref:efflux RND transporter periplasmic adaptor subunit n=1 Tax=unclassified Roseibium TaxID=2629323 RepID=UPI00273F35FC|nr:MULTISPECIES: efflux RND transporter periplasmic adaptor subunit [unclassified Roseibium]
MSKDHQTPQPKTTGSKRRLRRFGGMALSTATFSINVGLAAAAVMIGVTTIQMRAEEKPSVEPSPLALVDVFTPVWETGYDVERSFVGRLEPARSTDLAFELSGTVREVRVDEGDLVEEGDVIAVLDTRTLEADRRRQVANRQAAESDRELASLTLNRRQLLKDNGHVSAQVLDEARLTLSRLDATIAQIDAAIDNIDINLDKAVLKAPFSGRIGERLLDDGATASPATPVLRLLESPRPTVRIGLSPEVVDRLDRSHSYDIQISGRTFKAGLAALRPDLQTRTRTIETLFELDTPEATPAFGRLAELSVVERVETEGAWIPISALKEGPRGLWTVLTVAEDVDSAAPSPAYVVVREAVEVLHAEEGRAFVRGTLTPDSRIVRDGVHRVVVGQAVDLAKAGG